MDWPERTGLLFGVLVISGLLIEYGPEIMQAAIHLRIPHRGVMGGVLITLGVAGEVIFEGIVSHTVKQIQQAADLKVAELYERAAKSELELERVRAEAMEHQSEAE